MKISLSDIVKAFTDRDLDSIERTSGGVEYPCVFDVRLPVEEDYMVFYPIRDITIGTMRVPIKDHGDIGYCISEPVENCMSELDQTRYKIAIIPTLHNIRDILIRRHGASVELDADLIEFKEIHILTDSDVIEARVQSVMELRPMFVLLKPVRSAVAVTIYSQLYV